MPPNVAHLGQLEKMPRQRGRCTSCLCMSWKVFACIFSHVMLISLVVAYCLFGSYAFERLESENEKNVSGVWVPVGCCVCVYVRGVYCEAERNSGKGKANFMRFRYHSRSFSWKIVVVVVNINFVTCVGSCNCVVVILFCYI